MKGVGAGRSWMEGDHKEQCGGVKLKDSSESPEKKREVGTRQSEEWGGRLEDPWS